MSDDQRCLVVDGNNVMGAAADGWWRDRAGAARRLVDRLRCYSAETGRPITVVFDVAPHDTAEGDHGGVTVRYATRPGRDAADDRIVELLDGFTDPVEVVTSDRDLVARTQGPDRRHTGAGAFLHRLAERGC